MADHIRDFRLQTAINVWKVFQRKEMTWRELWSYLADWGRGGKSRPKANKLFDRRDFGYFKTLLFKLGKEDPLWFPRLFEPTTLGIRGWEYALLFERNVFKNKKVLDVGSGNSRLPERLAKKGAMVTMMDMENPLEETAKKKARNLKFVLGDMTRMTFKDRSFDMVICISALEHVDMKPVGFFTEAEYFRRAESALKEMMRVLKPGGRLYVTTEFYLPEQKSDKWIFSDHNIRGSFKFEYLPKMLSLLTKLGIEFDSKPEIDPQILRSDSKRANFRGRYMSTYAIRGKKL